MVYRFGACSLDSAAREVISRDGELHLSPKAFELLSMLLAAAPRAVTKSEILERIWPAIFVQETNIAGLIAEIRRALRATDGSDCIRTVYRFGYRFSADVIVEPGTPPATVPCAGSCLRIVVCGGVMTIEDPGGTDGTYLNGARIAAPASLADGDELRFGGVAVKFRAARDVHS